MSAQISLDYRTNRDLFSNHYLDDHLPNTEAWNDVSEEELEDAYDRIQSLWERERDTAPQRNESQLEEKFIRPMFRELGIPFEVEESVDRGQRRPDYGFFESEEAARGAFQRREEDGDFYENAVAVADAKRWGRALDTRGERERDFENPSYQIHVYLQETPAQWAVLTNGKKWRLYYGPTSHRLDSYYEIDLPTVLEQGDREAFKYFYLFFRQEAFLPDASGDSFLDDVYHESNIFAQELGEDLQDNIYEAIKVLSEGFLQYPDNDLGAEELDDADLLPDTRSSFEEARLDLVHDASLIYLYRLIFVLYAESEGRDLLDTDNDIYADDYSLNSLKQEVAEERDSADPSYRDWQDDLWSRLDDLFTLIDQGSKSKGIPEDQLYVPAYNGGLFRTDPEEDDSREARFLARYEAGDEHLAEVIDLLTRSENATGGGKIFVDYSSLDIRHLGSIYEGLLEYELNVAGEPLTLEDGEYVSANVGDDVEVETGDVYLTTDSGERKATGSYYTPEYVVEYIVENTLGPLVNDIYQDLLASDPWGQEGGGQFAEDFADRVFELKILDPAMGSGHFLTSAVDYLAREIINAQERQAEQQGVESIDQSHDINWARRQVAQRCIYGVDLNPLAVELAKVSLWLRTLAAEQPLAFLDHHLKTGNSLVGSDIEDVLDNSESGADDGQLTLQQSFARTRQQALEHVMDRFQDLLSIDNESLEDIKEMEAAFEEVRDDPLYQHLLAMANVHTAEEFGLDVPSDAYERMAEALRDDSWDEIEGQDWFRSAQAMAEEEEFFHWELEFPVAFYDEDGGRANEDGFDAVLGNPPYGMIKSDALGGYCESNYDVAEARHEIYKFFCERGYRLTAPEGYFGYIISNTLFTNQFDQKIRELLLTKTSWKSIVTFQGDVFEDPTIHPAIFVVEKSLPSQNHEVELLTKAAASTPVQEWEKRHINQSLYINSEDFLITVIPDKGEAEVWHKLGSKGRKLGDIAHIRQCIKTGDNDEYLERFDEEPEKPWRPVLTGSDIGRYHIEWPNRYVKYGDWLARNWKNEDFYERSKIAIRETSDRITAALDEENKYLLSTLYSVYYRDDFESENSLKYLLGVINSNAAQFYMYQLVFALNEGAFTKARTNHYERLPILLVTLTRRSSRRRGLLIKNC